MSITSIWKNFDDSDLKGYTLVIPSVAVGNVGQLSCDLLISSLNMVKIASVYTTALIPVLGYDPYDLNSSQLLNSCEAYKSVIEKVVVLQIRSPLMHKHAREFLEELIKKFKAKNITDIVILTSSYAHEKKHVSTSPFRYVVNESYTHINKIKEMKWTAHELEDTILKIYGGGFASLLYEICAQESLPTLMLYKYCSEGNNIPDAYEMIHYLASLLPIFSESKDLSSQMVQPVSWKLLFGRPPPVDIY